MSFCHCLFVKSKYLQNKKDFILLLSIKNVFYVLDCLNKNCQNKQKNQAMNGFSKIGRYIFALPFLAFGLFHFMGPRDMIDMVPLPGGVFWVYLTGIALVTASIAMMIGRLDRWAGIFLGAMLLTFALLVHLPGIIMSDGENPMAMSSFLKDTALAGAAWMYTAIAKDK